MTRRRVTLGQESVEILDVPYVTQRPQVAYCFVAALKMSWDYIRSTYGNTRPLDSAPELSMDLLAALTRVDPLTGVQVNQSFIDRFNAGQRLVDAAISWGVDTVSLHRLAASGLPVIVCYYPNMCEHPGTSTSGVGHACVYLASSEQLVLIHNPWYGPLHTWPKNSFETSRKNLGGLVISFRIRSTLDVTRPSAGEGTN